VVRKGALITAVTTAGTTSASLGDTIHYAKLVADRLQ
jgi:hypothetical protein